MRQKESWLRWGILALDLLWICFIFARSLQTAESSTVESGALLRVMRRVDPALTDHTIRKTAHFTEFCVLGVLLYLSCLVWRLRLPMLAWVPALAIAGLDELIQSFVPGRSSELRDVLIDAAGALAGCLVCLLWQRLRQKRRRETAGGGENDG